MSTSIRDSTYLFIRPQFAPSRLYSVRAHHLQLIRLQDLTCTNQEAPDTVTSTRSSVEKLRMLVIFIFFLAFLASFSSGTTFHDHGVEPLHGFMRRQKAISKREDAHPVSVNFQTSTFRFGLESYCDVPFNVTTLGGHQYKIEDCVGLIDLLAGHDHYRGYWLIGDWRCLTSGDYWWATVAGYGTCNFAVVAPTASLPRWRKQEVVPLL